MNLVADTALGSPPSGHLVDGQGIALNRWLQAIQLGHRQLESTLARSDSPVEILGVSGTAAVFRTDALRRLSCPTGVLDERLQSYYEDFDLACRLRALGYTAWLAPEARAKHRPSTTASREPRRKEALIYGNRWLVLAKVLGRAFPAAIPRALARDLIDLAHAALSRSGPSAAGLLGGWARAARRLPAFVSFDAPMLDRRTRGRFTVGAQAPHAASGGPS